jgi:hypothetical protein
MLIIQEPLPYNTVQKTALKSAKQGSGPILPTFEFKEQSQSEDVKAAMTHEGITCDNCGKKPVIGNLFKCANCEDFNLCDQCYTQNQFEHFSYHVFMKFLRPLKQQEKNPTTLLQVLDPRLYPQNTQLSKLTDSPSKKAVFFEEEGDSDFDDLQPLSMARSLSMPVTHTPSKKQTPLAQNKQ